MNYTNYMYVDRFINHKVLGILFFIFLNLESDDQIHGYGHYGPTNKFNQAV